MANELRATAARIAAELDRLDDERLRVGREGMKALEHLDPETAAMAKSLWDDPEHAADWFIQKVQSLQWRTPWRCIAEGHREDVQKILNKIAYGVPM